MDDFSARAPAEEVTALIRAVGQVARELGIADEGYRTLVNVGTNGGQEVPHLHFHIFGGRSLGPMLATG
jgi:histidine triad (HIT) family protein